MEATQTKVAKGLALVSAPWPLYDRPSIQLGALSAWIKGALLDCPVDAHYAYLNVANSIGYPVAKCKFPFILDRYNRWQDTCKFCNSK